MQYPKVSTFIGYQILIWILQKKIGNKAKDTLQVVDDALVDVCVVAALPPGTLSYKNNNIHNVVDLRYNTK